MSAHVKARCPRALLGCARPHNPGVSTQVSFFADEIQAAESL
jgi:hypothetical protein